MQSDIRATRFQVLDADGAQDFLCVIKRTHAYVKCKFAERDQASDRSGPLWLAGIDPGRMP